MQKEHLSEIGVACIAASHWLDFRKRRRWKPSLLELGNKVAKTVWPLSPPVGYEISGGVVGVKAPPEGIPTPWQ